MRPARFLPLLALGLLASTAAAQIVPLDSFIVTSRRALQPSGEVPFATTVLSSEDVEASPALTLDGVLRGVPGFSLFRRSDSLVANPTTQGVSLRGLGPSGASRSLVLLDGIPLNDPFGGWIAWSKVPRLAIDRVEVIRGGGGTAWGNAALAGVVHVLTVPPAQPRRHVGLTGGSFGTRSAELSLAEPIGSGALQVFGRWFATDGYYVLAPSQRGPVDTRANSRHHTATVRWHQPLGAHLTATLTGRWFSEQRGNGTRYQRNHTREGFGSLVIDGRPHPGLTWTASLYGQEQNFASTFSSVTAGRTVETPASEQFAVPADALGAAWTGTWGRPTSAQTTLGGEVRRVRGETREDSSFVSGQFTRRRLAGGAQATAAAWLLHERELAARWQTNLGLRVEHWRETRGHRRETDLLTSAVLRDDTYPTRSGTELSPSGGLVWTPAREWRLRASAQHAFRRPTLNELYRPFRVGNVITEANARLQTERVVTAELGAQWTRGTLALEATGFQSELRDAVGNVTLVRGPATVPEFGFIPAGGVGRQRLNLDRTRVRGTELSARWSPQADWQVAIDYLWNDARVRRAAVAPELAGRRVAQVPRHSATLSAHWRGTSAIRATPRLRWIGSQFEDDENSLRLASAVVADLSLQWRLRPRLFLNLNGENLAQARIEAGRSADGLVTLGPPRLLSASLQTAW